MEDFATKKLGGISKMALFCPVQIKFDALFCSKCSHSAFKYAFYFL